MESRRTLRGAQTLHGLTLDVMLGSLVVMLSRRRCVAGSGDSGGGAIGPSGSSYGGCRNGLGIERLEEGIILQQRLVPWRELSNTAFPAGFCRESEGCRRWVRQSHVMRLPQQITTGMIGETQNFETKA